MGKSRGVREKYMKTNSKWYLLTALLLIVPTGVFSAAGQQRNSFIITGQHGSAKVIQVDGRNYVEVEGLARLTNGSIDFTGSQIVMSLPGTDADAHPAAAFSKEFVTAGIEAMTVIREWRASLK